MTHRGFALKARDLKSTFKECETEAGLGETNLDLVVDWRPSLRLWGQKRVEASMLTWWQQREVVKTSRRALTDESDSEGI